VELQTTREEGSGESGAHVSKGTEALPVLAGVLPLDLEVKKWGFLARS